MARVLSALVLLPIVLGTIWWLPPVGTLVLTEIVLLLAYIEYADLAGRLGARVPRLVAGLGVMATCAAMGWPGASVPIVLMASTIAIGGMAVGSGRPGEHVLHDVGASLFPVLYLGLPAGAIVAVRTEGGPAALFVLLLTIVVSDTAQFYGGRTFGRRLLAPTISPKKTIEGALTGFVVGSLATLGLGLWGLPGARPISLIVLGATIVALGIVGDLFESVLKRSAGVKDASGLIPGHGGMLDRIDSLVFAAPVYYVFLKHAW